MTEMIEPNNKVEHCTRCEKSLDPKKIVWLELSMTDGKYYDEIPIDHISQGAFPFGQACAITQLKEQQ